MRRRLFSNEDGQVRKRRLLFSDNAVTNQIDKPNLTDIVMCMDCHTAYTRDGASTTNFICPNCGGNRFEVVDNVKNEPIPVAKGTVIDAPSRDVRCDDECTDRETKDSISKAFSKTRRRLFNDNGAIGGNKGPSIHDVSGEKLVNKDGSALTNKFLNLDSTNSLYTCPDCGHQFTAKGTENIGVRCPRCGGDRCRMSSLKQSDPNIVSDEYVTDKLDELLSDVEGKTFSEGMLKEKMSEYGISGNVRLFANTGYARINDNGTYTFNDSASSDRRFFSKLVISVSKEFDIDPTMDRDMAINSLSERMPEKSILLLKRAGGYGPETTNFSDKDFLVDSGISNDLSAEYGGTSIPLKSFMNMLNEEYPDAPENIIDLLVEDKVIKISGSNVQISK